MAQDFRLNKSDLLLIAHLRQNGRKKLTQLSKATGMAVSTIYDRMAFLNSCIIQRYLCLVDFVKLGFPIRATVVLKSNKPQREQLQKYLLRHPAVNNVKKINNSYDFLIEVLFSDLKPFEEFLLRLQDDHGVNKLEVFHLIEELKQEAFLSEPGSPLT